MRYIPQKNQIAGARMDYGQAEGIERSTKEFWEQRIGDKAYELISPIWENWILPSLKVNAAAADTGEKFRERWIRAMSLTQRLFEALHSNHGYARDEERPRFFWMHQQFEVLRANDAKRGISIDKAEMLGVAAEYLSHPEIRCNKFDWLLLDAIVFAELDAFTSVLTSSKASTGMAVVFADGNQFKYFAFLALFRSISFALNYVAPPAIAVLALSKGHDITGWTIAGLWAFSMVWTLIGVPVRWKMRRKNKELWTNLHDLYRILGDSTISPRVLKEALDKAAASGVVLDGAVFSIVDRLIARDATTFVPNQVG